ncbi:peptide chain release factor 1 [Candidatus Legionella polyplacis]|uniref:Peptide chain release factor 1 n=1 Tax=Candidatus Legionella polyplacis TaxID=2005262 RepID=A0ABZ2GYS7_9GAMM|nr:peptide chain release factor 1 [Candidatus Legionella polyplacis]ATW01854.1 peptide chain release factor 1 [Candidatus Legionella polyplacis]
MQNFLQKKLEKLQKRFDQINKLFLDTTIITNYKKSQKLLKEFTKLKPIIELYNTYKNQKNTIKNLIEISKDNDKELSILAKEEIEQTKKTVFSIEKKIELLFPIKNTQTDRNVYLEIRAGIGGQEASIFSKNLFRMYNRYAEIKGWNLDIINISHNECGGYKEIIAKIQGKEVYSNLKFESGVHRVQRIPKTESQGRIHTSACTVAILPEAVDIDEIIIHNNDLRIDTFKASGAGGQHVNKTDSAIRITHIPSNISIECQDERSQHKNKSKAIALLKAKLLNIKKNKKQKQQAQTRKSLIGTGDRSERIRTYNFPKKRLTDHRINLTLYTLNDILEGNLHPVIEALKQKYLN